MIGMEQQVQIRGADGSVLWAGAAVMGVPVHVVNDDAAAIQLGEGVKFDAADGAAVIPRMETTAAGATPAADLPMSVLLKALRIASAADTNFLGVSVEPIAIGKNGLLAGIGSLLTVQTTATQIVVTSAIGGSATAGRAAAETTAGEILGNCMKTNTVASPGTGSTGWAGILVNPR